MREFRTAKREFRESGSNKRRTPSADNWAPATGEILITFDPVEAGDALPSDRPAEAVSPNADPDEVSQALAEAETGRWFVALKWFRDELLPAKFRPVPIAGEPLSDTILGDGGPR